MADLPNLSDPDRLQAVRDTGLLDSPPEQDFDQLTRMAARLVGAPNAFITILDDQRQFLKSAEGTEGTDFAGGNSTSLDMSFCKHVVSSKEPLIVRNAREHELVRHNKAVDAGVIAYAGIPLETNEGQAIGALCVVDSKPREWSEDDLNNLRALARSTMKLLDERAAAARPKPEQTQDKDAGILHCVELHLRAMDRYAALIRGADLPDLASESAAQSEVTESFQDLRSAFERRSTTIKSVAADGPLFYRIAAYVEAEDRRNLAVKEFADGHTDLRSLETDIAAALEASDALRVAALNAGADL